MGFLERFLGIPTIRPADASRGEPTTCPNCQKPLLYREHGTDSKYFWCPCGFVQETWQRDAEMELRRWKNWQDAVAGRKL